MSHLAAKLFDFPILLLKKIPALLREADLKSIRIHRFQLNF